MIKTERKSNLSSYQLDDENKLRQVTSQQEDKVTYIGMVWVLLKAIMAKYKADIKQLIQKIIHKEQRTSPRKGPLSPSPPPNFAIP